MSAPRWAIVYATCGVLMALIGAIVAGLFFGLLAIVALLWEHR